MLDGLEVLLDLLTFLIDLLDIVLSPTRRR
jgi:hypothetical protein